MVTVLVAGSGGAFTGLSSGRVRQDDHPVGGLSKPSTPTDNFSNVVRVNYWNGATQYKINGVGRGLHHRR